MEVCMNSSIFVISQISPTTSKALFRANQSKSSTVDLTANCCRGNNHSRPMIRSKRRLQVGKVAGIDGVSAAADTAGPAAGLTWQIVVGAAAGVTPFVVAGIEFSKRIIAQRRCEVCGGSGLVLRKEFYVRCAACGGFLPWQSWKRFFSG